MIGYIMGLGDRHCENILLDTCTGETVHVDFNCLFNKGLTFEIPEKVPFRLTHNIVDGMGTLGVEGVFRKTCEIILHLIRDERELLVSVLKTFIYDPLVEWKSATREEVANMKKQQIQVEGGEVVNMKVTKYGSIPLLMYKNGLFRLRHMFETSSNVFVVIVQTN